MADPLEQLNNIVTPYTGKAQFKGVQPQFLENFEAMAQEFYALTGQQIKVNDAFRSHEAQAEAYKNKPNLAAKPGHSRHELGEAMDLDSNQATRLAKMGLLDKYGFTRPMLGQGKSGKNEPWHIELANFEKAGKVAAQTPQADPLAELENIVKSAPGGAQTPQADPLKELGSVTQPTPAQPAAPTTELSAGPPGIVAPVTESPLWGKIREPLEKGAKAIDETLFPAWPIPKKYAPTPAQSLLEMLYPKSQKEAMIGGIAGLGMGMIKGEPTPGGAGLIPRPGTEVATKRELSALEKVVGMERFNPEEMHLLMNTAKQEFGIDLTVPEITNSPTLKAHWTALAKTPGTPAERIATFIEGVRQPQVEAAIRRELAQVSPAQVTSYQAGGQARAVAQKTEEGLRTARTTTTRPMYQKAYEEARPVDVSGVTGEIDNFLQYTPSGSSREGVLKKVKGMLVKEPGNLPDETGMIRSGKPVGDVLETDLRKLHGTKEEIDRMLEAAKADKSIDNDTRRILTRIKAKLQGQMEADNPLYARAQQTFRLLSKPLTDFRYGSPNLGPRDPKVKTLIARMADTGEEQIGDIPGMVFGESPEVIARTKRYFEQKYPGTWDSLVRAKLEEELGKAKDTVVARAGGNMGLDFKRRVLNTPGDRRVWRTALGPEKYARLQKFMDVLDKTSRIVYTSSETPFQLAAQKIQDAGGAAEFLDRIPTSTGGAIKRSVKWLAEIFDKTKKASFQSDLADALLSPEYALEISRLARLTNPAKQAVETAELLSRIGVTETGSRLTGRTKSIPTGKQAEE